MKEHIISYVLKNAEWWSGLNITNHSFLPTSVYIEYFESNGACPKTEEIYLFPKCSTTFAVTGINCGWARAISSDNVTIMEFFGRGMGAADPFQGVIIPQRDVIVKNVIQPNAVKTLIRNTPFVDDLCDCKYFHKQYLDIIEYIGRAIYYKYPDRNAKKLEVIDGAPPDFTDCLGHPAGTHRDGETADFHYYTMRDTNHTQKGTGIIPIWTDGNLNENFDKERTVDFFLLFHKIFPKAATIVDQRIKAAIATTAWQMYGDLARDIINAKVQGDDPERYNHHLHAHCNYTGGWSGTGLINWEAII